MEQYIQLSNNVTLELTVKEEEGGCITLSQRFIDSKGNFLSKTCTVTCGTPPNTKSHSWTCADDKNCEGDCSDPNNPKGRCV